MFLQPLLIMGFRQVSFPGVGQEDHQDIVRSQRLRDAARGDHGGPARAPREDRFFPGQSPGHEVRLFVRDLHDFVDVLEPGGFRDEVFSDPLDLVRVRFYCLLLIEIVLQNGTEWVHADDSDLRVPFLQVVSHSADGPAGAHPAHEVGDLAIRVPPDLRSGRLIMGSRIRLVGILIRQDRVRGLAMNAFRDPVVGLRMVRRHGRRRHDDASSQGLQEIDFLSAHLVRHREHRPVPLDRRDHGKAQPGVPARRLDDRSTGPQGPLRLRVLDHLLADAVLHAPSGIHHLELRQDETLHTVHDLRQLDEGRVPDGLQNARIVPHGRPGEHQRSDVIRTCAPRCHSPVGIPDLPLARDNRDVPGEGVEPPGNRSAVGHISRSVTPAPVCAFRETVLKFWSTMSTRPRGSCREFRL